MALDTLPSEGRVLLLAVLLTCMLYGFARVLPDDQGSSLNVLYHKGALLALLLVPASVYFLNIQVPVPVEEVVRFDTPVPRYVASGLLALWAVGCLFHLGRLGKDLRATFAAVHNASAAHSQMTARAQHWQKRLNLKGDVRILSMGAEQGWHVNGISSRGRRSAAIVLPAAALNWPAGVVDALLLTQLAQLYQGSWRWLVFGRVVQAIYWPMPWVGILLQRLARHLLVPGLKLASAAYRDPEGWQRDLRNLTKRASTLAPVADPHPGALVRLANSGARIAIPSAKTARIPPQVDTFEVKWAGTKRHKRDKERDPYEQVYWLIALASIVVGVASTLTLVRAPPEFDPQYLQVKWQDQMIRKLRDFYADKPPQSNPEPPKQRDANPG